MAEGEIANGAPFEMTDLVLAMTERDVKGSLLIERIGSELEGVELVHSSPAMIEAIFKGRLFLNASRLRDPKAISTFSDSFARTYDQGGFELLAADLNQLVGDEEILRGTDVQTGFTAFANELGASTGLEATIAEDFQALLAAARIVADEHYVSVATVYKADSLYYEASMRSMPASLSADRYHKMVKGISGTVIKKMLTGMMPSDLLDESERAQIEQELCADKAFQETVAAAADDTKEIMRQAFLYDFVRSYGRAALRELTNEQRQELMPRKPIVPSVRYYVEDKM